MITLSDFISTELITLNVNGRVFKIKEMNGREKDLMDNASLKYDSENNSFKLDLSIKNVHYLKLVKETPYEEFKTCPNTVDFLNNLKPSIRKELLKQIKLSIDSEGDIEKK